MESAEQEEMGRIRIGLICAGILLIALLFITFVLVIGDMFNKKLWI
jgi:hypothetical protein